MYIRRYFLVMMAVLGILAACSDDHDDVRPGIYVENQVMESFPGDTLNISGQISNYVGMKSVSLVCDDWKINQTYDLSNQNPKVWMLNCQVPVPKDAKFDNTLKIVVADINGLENVREVQVVFAPDTKSPTFVNLDDYISVDYDLNKKEGVYQMNFLCCDDREVASMTVKIPGLGYEETFKGAGKRQVNPDKQLTFTETGTYEMYLSATDVSGNVVSDSSSITVLPTEAEDPIENYNQMYAVQLVNENPDDYIDGYYHYMKKVGDYQYQCVVHAESATDGFLFVPSKTMKGYVYGSSPYANFKILNKAGYVKPTCMSAAGYYTLTIDIQKHSFKAEPLDVTKAYNNNSLLASGDGFRSWDDWGAMKKIADYCYKIYADQDGSAKPEWGRYYYFVGVTADGGWDWSRIFRADAEGHEWYETDGGSGALTYDSQYDGKVEVTFDTAIPYGTIKKVK